MSKRAKGFKGIVIDFNTVNLYKDYIVTWFANVATHYLIGKRVEVTKEEDLNDLCQKANEYVSMLREKRKGEGKKDKVIDVCEEIPLNLTPNDDQELFRLCKAIDYICSAAQGKVGFVGLPPALSLEFAEHIRVYIPSVSPSYKRTENIGVALHMIGLAVLGAHIAMTYILRENKRVEIIYTYADVPISGDIDFRKLHGMVRSVVSSVMRGEGGRLTLLCGAASAIVLNYGRKLRETTGLVLESVRTMKSGNKVMLKAFEALDLTDLARTIFRLGIAGPIYNLTSNYPATDTREARLVKSFIENLSKAIITHYSIRDLQELYRTLRALTSETTINALKAIYGSEDLWKEIYEGLLEVKVL